MTRNPRIAIVGIGGVFPGSSDLESFWQSIRDAHSQVRDVPKERWALDKGLLADSSVGRHDRTYSVRACFVEQFELDPHHLHISRDLIEQLDPIYQYVLQAGRDAWMSSVTTALDRSRVSVIIGNIALPTSRSSQLGWQILGRTIAEHVGRAIHAEKDLNIGDNRFRVHAEDRCQPGLPAAILSQSLELGGGTYSLDAACASSLYALKLACDQLVHHRMDAVIAGGASRPDSMYTQVGFSQLRALSPSGKCSPLDEKADGLVVGEGAGMFVLKRLEDAVEHGDHIHGVISGIGLSSDTDGNLLAPSSEGQLRAMRTAYDQAGWQPADVDLIECHATGTPVGDAVEISSLKKLWEGSSNTNRCVLGCVKSNVGHLLTGAGAAGLMKVLLALHHEELPPTANFESSPPSSNLDESPFRVLTHSTPWETRQTGTPRRAAVNAFGFGGINAHVLIEEFLPARKIHRETTSLPVSPIVISGLDCSFPHQANLNEFIRACVFGENRETAAKSLPSNWWGIEQSNWFCKEHDVERYRGHYFREIAVSLKRFRIPPRELQDMLPQQLLMMLVASRAVEDAGWEPNLRLRTGVFIGIGLDQNTANFHVRWALSKHTKNWLDQNTDYTRSDIDDWLARLKDDVWPPLTANRTMGALGGVIASRIGREYRIGGPCFTIASDETSGLRALESAMRAIQEREIDQAIVGAVDLSGDPRHLIPQDGPLAQANGVGEGAVALVLRRQDPNTKTSKNYASVGGLGACMSPDKVPDIWNTLSMQAALREAQCEPSSMGLIECHNQDQLKDDENIRDVGRFVGDTGATAGLASVCLAACSLAQRTLPPTHPPTPGEPNSPSSTPWIHNRSQGPRRAAIHCHGTDQNQVSLVLNQSDTPSHQLRGQLPREESLWIVTGDEPEELVRGLTQLRDFVDKTDGPLAEAAALWFNEHPSDHGQMTVTMVPRSRDELHQFATKAHTRLSLEPDKPIGSTTGSLGMANRLFYSPQPLADEGELAFVFPGSGNHYDGMGQQLAQSWPEILEHLDSSNLNFKDQFGVSNPLRWQHDESDARSLIFGQVTFGTLARHVLHHFAIQPKASIGYSLGESAAMFALDVWTDRDEMLDRMMHSSLFVSDLTGPCHAAHKHWGLGKTEKVKWLAGVVDRPAHAVRSAIGTRKRVYLLIINTHSECVIGGDITEVQAVVSELGANFVKLTGVSSVHCEVVREVSDQYHQLHRLQTTPPSDIRFYSGAWGKTYDLSDQSPADAILAHALEGVDFPTLIENAYEDKVKLFVELGPSSSCSRMISSILVDRPHMARSISSSASQEVSTLLRLVAHLIAEGYMADPAIWYRKYNDLRVDSSEQNSSLIQVPVRAEAIVVPPLPSQPQLESSRQNTTEPDRAPVISNPPPEARVVPGGAHSVLTGPSRVSARGDSSDVVEAERVPLSPAQKVRSTTPMETDPSIPKSDPTVPTTVASQPPLKPPLHSTMKPQTPAGPISDGEIAGIQVPEANLLTRQDPIRLITDVEQANNSAHTAYLTFASEAAAIVSRNAALQMHLAASSEDGFDVNASDLTSFMADHGSVTRNEWPEIPGEPVPSLNRQQCMEFAIGQIGHVLGEKYRAIDSAPTRVRLPDEPLMLVDRITHIEGEALSMSPGRVVTEHDVRDGLWYLDNQCIPTCIAVEAGQADLFLSGYMGIDFETNGLAVYRLLDATVTFHGSLPSVGSVIQYDIRIERFFRHAGTWFFHFGFESTVNGRPLLTMRNGCAGFFTAKQLASGAGIVQTRLDKKPALGIRPDDWTDLVLLERESYSDAQVEALRTGDLGSCFGQRFAELDLQNPMQLPGGLMRLVHRVTMLDPTAGRFGLGQIVAEADIDPKDWFLVCHFVDDRVMPGTLMYECCMHTLRILLMRMGWVGEHGQVQCEPVPGIESKLKCRGQVIDTTKRVTYEVSLKEIGFGPEPFAIANALMYADGKPIVEISDMSIRMSGLSREELEQRWNRVGQPTGSHTLGAHGYDGAVPPDPMKTPRGTSVFEGNWGLMKPAIYDSDSILAYSIGLPSKAFGVRYREFDERFLARLPGPPYLFLDRVTYVDAPPWELEEGGVIEAQYDVPPDEWYFDANADQGMPYAVLLEIALQPCGWFAAYMGSALTSQEPLHFRNLGGTATQHQAVDRNCGTLTTRIKVTKIAQSAGMIIQHFDLDVRNRNGPVYQGQTYFGFFSQEALGNQVGVRGVSLYNPSPRESLKNSSIAYPVDAPYPSSQLRMINQIEHYEEVAGPTDRGWIRGSKDVVPDEWFFQAHFYQDPVIPGSLGLESYLQLLKYFALQRWQGSIQTVCIGHAHTWVYRGQVIPRNRRVTVEAYVKEIDDENQRIRADGVLSVDGIVIYQMSDFTLSVSNK